MFLYGVVAISAMLLPGISGSFILLILGQYERVISSLESLLHGDLSGLSVVVPFSLGCLVGIAAFSRIVAWLLHRYFDPVMAALSGLLLGSLWRIWPFQDTVTQEVRGKIKVIEATPMIPEQWEVLPLALIAVGFAIVFLIEFLAKKRASIEPQGE
jgi:putative membrane protein